MLNRHDKASVCLKNVSIANLKNMTNRSQDKIKLNF